MNIIHLHLRNLCLWPSSGAFHSDLGACGYKTWIIDQRICCSAVQNRALSDRNTLERGLKCRDVASSLTKLLRKEHQHGTGPHKHPQLQRCPADHDDGFVVWQKHCLWGVRMFQKSKTTGGSLRLGFSPVFRVCSAKHHRWGSLAFYTVEFSSFKLFGGLGLCFLVCFPFFRGLAWILGLGFSPACGREGFSSSSFLLFGLRVPFLSFLVLSFPFFSLLLFVLLALLTLGGSAFSFFPLYLLVFWLGCFCFFFFFFLWGLAFCWFLEVTLLFCCCCLGGLVYFWVLYFGFFAFCFALGLGVLFVWF